MSTSPRRPDLPPPTPNLKVVGKDEPRPSSADAFDYLDASHSVVCQVLYNPLTGDARWFHDVKGKRVRGLKGVHPPVYNLVEVQTWESPVCFLFPDERQAHDATRRLGVVGTCFPDTSHFRDEEAAVLKGRKVVVVAPTAYDRSDWLPEAVATLNRVGAIPLEGDPAWFDPALDHDRDEIEAAGMAARPISDRALPPDNESGWTLEARKASDYKIRPVKFLSKPRLARGVVTLVAGAGGSGKSTLLEDTAARGTTGRPMLGAAEAHVDPFHVIILANEDGHEDALIPRLVAAEADLEKIRLVEGIRSPGGELIPFDIRHVPLLREEVVRGRAQGRDVRLILIDPITTFVGRAGVDDHRDAQLKPALEALSSLAQDLDLSVVAIAHLNKGGGAQTAANRVLGGIAYVSSSRCAYVYAEDPTDPHRRILAPIKSNLPGGKPPALAVHVSKIDPDRGHELIGPYASHLDDQARAELVDQLYKVGYLGDTNQSAEELLKPAAAKAPSDHITAAVAWLEERLASGPAGSTLVAMQGDKYLGREWPGKDKPDSARMGRVKWWRETILKAKLGGVSRKLGMDAWFFSLPGQSWPPLADAIADARNVSGDDASDDECAKMPF